MIVPLALLGDQTCAPTRKYMIEASSHVIFECFPQKDDPARRVFNGAKLATVVFVASKHATNASVDADLAIRSHPADRIEGSGRACMLKASDLKRIDPKTLPVPMASIEEVDLCLRIHRDERVVRLGAMPDFRVTRGEINQTIYRKYITNNPEDERLLKGAEICRFGLNIDITQGRREWFVKGGAKPWRGAGGAIS